jgi:hypothetical protein
MEIAEVERRNSMAQMSVKHHYSVRNNTGRKARHRWASPH